MKSEKPNRLICEKSPYLLEHAYDPVDWYPWGDEAFEKAQKENKPVFLSIGYSTCHWCHVMQEESFQDSDAARILNESFVAIKVDREERPDLDSVYMSFVLALNESGGWPLSVFLTPQKKPFYGGTYFPPHPRAGLPGFKELLRSIYANWLNHEEKIRDSADVFVSSWNQNFYKQADRTQVLEPGILGKAYRQLAENFDVHNGGFGGPPKFPTGHVLSFLLRYWKNNDEPQALAMVEKTLVAMALGGVYDQLGGGFHRYATDAGWQVPHFEKMLYDQALLSKIYLEAFLATGKPFYADIARQILDYVLCDMQDSQGGFFTAQDADSLDHSGGQLAPKSEGAFYLWEEKQMEEILDLKQMRVLAFYYGIQKSGNVFFDPHGEFAGKNILSVRHSLEETAAYADDSVENVAQMIEKAKEKLRVARQQRPRPFLDDKILTDSNGLMISSFALAGRILGEKRYLDAARRAAEFVLSNLRQQDGRLLRRYRQKEAGVAATLDDYAFFICGLLDLYENSFEWKYFKQAVGLNAQMMDLFWDQDKGGFFLTAKDAESLILRLKQSYDGAVPSGNSLGAHNLLRFYHFTGERKYLEKSEAVLNLFFHDVSLTPSAYAQMMMSLQFYFGPVREIVVCSRAMDANAHNMVDEVFKTWIAQKVVIVKTGEEKDLIEEFLPLSRHKDAAGENALVYVCENQTCRKPSDTISDLQKALR